MLRTSRLLSAGCLGLAMAAALAANIGGVEVNPARKALATRVAATPGGRVIVKFRQRAGILSAATAGGARLGPRAAAILSSRLNVALTDGRAIGPSTQVLKSAVLDSKALAALVAAEADVEWAEVDQRRVPMAAPNDPLYPNGLVATTPASGQWYLRAPSGIVKSGVDIETAWNVTRGAGVAVGTPIVIADIDTGITSHPDLVNKILPGYDFIGYASGDSGLSTANDGDLDDSNPTDPGDWITSAENASGDFKGCADPDDAEDSSWHGTQTAGILGAQTNNGLGMAGTGYDIMVLPVRAMGKCGGYDSDIIAGMRWAAGIAVSGAPVNAHPARVINMSLGGTGACPSQYTDVLSELGTNVVVVAAAGNEEGIAVDAPANCPGVIGVAALRQTGSKVGFSNVGSEVTIAAPGGNCINTEVSSACLYPILTTVNTGTTTPGAASYSTSFGAVSVGTSFSTPIVAGTVGLMLSANPLLKSDQIITMLRGTATAFPTTSDSANVPTCHAPNGVTQDECICTTTTCGAGMLNAGLAVQRAAGATGGVAVISDQGVAAVGTNVTLSSAGSAASAGAVIANYDWSIADGQSHAAIVGSAGGATATTVTLQPTSSGSVTVKLVTTDNAGKTGVAFRTFPVAAVGPVASISGIAGVGVGQSVLLSGANSVPPGIGSIASYAWTVTTGSTLVSPSSGTGSTITLSGVAAGDATVQLVVTDTNGATSTATLVVPVSLTTATSGGSGGGSSSGGGGGGATSPLWLAGLAIAGLLLAPRRRLAAVRVRRS